jgi:hypothetical protein
VRSNTSSAAGPFEDVDLTVAQYRHGIHHAGDCGAEVVAPLAILGNQHRRLQPCGADLLEQVDGTGILRAVVGTRRADDRETVSERNGAAQAGEGVRLRSRRQPRLIQASGRGARRQCKRHGLGASRGTGRI